VSTSRCLRSRRSSRSPAGSRSDSPSDASKATTSQPLEGVSRSVVVALAALAEQRVEEVIALLQASVMGVATAASRASFDANSMSVVTLVKSPSP
jgi:hypothetical protein